jgi:benzoate membrane transport protein
VSAVTAGLLAVIISYAGPLAIFFQAARSAHVGNEVVAVFDPGRPILKPKK